MPTDAANMDYDPESASEAGGPGGIHASTNSAEIAIVLLRALQDTVVSLGLSAKGDHSGLLGPGSPGLPCLSGNIGTFKSDSKLSEDVPRKLLQRSTLVDKTGLDAKSTFVETVRTADSRCSAKSTSPESRYKEGLSPGGPESCPNEDQATSLDGHNNEDKISKPFLRTPSPSKIFTESQAVPSLQFRGPGSLGSGPDPRPSGPGPRLSGPAPQLAGPGSHLSGPGSHLSGPGSHLSGPGPRSCGPIPRSSGPGPRPSGPEPRLPAPGSHILGSEASLARERRSDSTEALELFLESRTVDLRAAIAVLRRQLTEKSIVVLKQQEALKVLSKRATKTPKGAVRLLRDLTQALSTLEASSSSELNQYLQKALKEREETETWLNGELLSSKALATQLSVKLHKFASVRSAAKLNPAQATLVSLRTALTKREHEITELKAQLCAQAVIMEELKTETAVLRDFLTTMVCRGLTCEIASESFPSLTGTMSKRQASNSTKTRAESRTHHKRRSFRCSSVESVILSGGNDKDDGSPVLTSPDLRNSPRRKLYGSGFSGQPAATTANLGALRRQKPTEFKRTSSCTKRTNNILSPAESSTTSAVSGNKFMRFAVMAVQENTLYVPARNDRLDELVAAFHNNRNNKILFTRVSNGQYIFGRLPVALRLARTKSGKEVARVIHNGKTTSLKVFVKEYEDTEYNLLEGRNAATTEAETEMTPETDAAKFRSQRSTAETTTTATSPKLSKSPPRPPVKYKPERSIYSTRTVIDREMHRALEYSGNQMPQSATINSHVMRSKERGPQEVLRGKYFETFAPPARHVAKR